ncbi:hypothetical protein PybrP1_003763 [[Pythium] brassicae (nom. inval.)]|nr:hypothetical protein PybrP1_003763 [[Pythium] brassicae (nom. inval.)]
MASSAVHPNAAVCVIGNEVLTGKTHDTNSLFIANFMFRRGIDLKRIVVIPDEMDVISSTVKELSDLVGPSGYVFTTGGIGPTHDDITYEGVAKAFGLGVELHQPTVDGLREYLEKQHRGFELNEDRLRMALLPAGCKLLSTASWVPIAVVNNVYVLPGIPSMVREMLTHNEAHFVGVPIHRAIVHTLRYEGDIAKTMTAIQKKYPGVAIGSYINLTDQTTGVKDETYHVRMTVEGRDEAEVEKVADELAAVSEGTRFFGSETAAICVIANEVLTGKTHDTNSFFIAKLMFRRGVDVKRIVVIPDDLEIISSTVKELSDLVGPTGYVFTTGGIGPTHDDLTYEGVARAFGLGLEVHQPTADALLAHARKNKFGNKLNDEVLRMATLPVGCTVLSTGSWVPLAVVHNVYVLPGIPSIVSEMLTHNEEHFVGVPIHRAIVLTLQYEAFIAKDMREVQKKHPTVAIGSYVNLTLEKTGVKDESYNSRLTVEGRDKDEVEKTADELVAISSGFRPPGSAL